MLYILIDCLGFFAGSAIFQSCNDDHVYSQIKLNPTSNEIEVLTKKLKKIM